MVLTDHGRRDARGLAEESAQALARSQGFSVESPVGPLGTVEAVRYSGQPRQPHLLVVRMGDPDSQTLILVPASSVQKVNREAGRVFLRPGILLRRFRAPRATASSQGSSARPESKSQTRNKSGDQ